MRPYDDREWRLYEPHNASLKEAAALPNYSILEQDVNVFNRVNSAYSEYSRRIVNYAQDEDDFYASLIEEYIDPMEIDLCLDYFYMLYNRADSSPFIICDERQIVEEYRIMATMFCSPYDVYRVPPRPGSSRSYLYDPEIAKFRAEMEALYYKNLVM